MATKKVVTELVVYLLEMKDGSRKKITVPKSWKVTYGPLVPGSKDGNMNGAGALCLRFYEGNKDNQRAVFAGVQAFRDMSLPLEEEVTQTHEEIVSKETDQGQKSFVVRGEVKEWVNPDNPRPLAKEFKQLPQSLRSADD